MKRICTNLITMALAAGLLTACGDDDKNPASSGPSEETALLVGTWERGTGFSTFTLTFNEDGTFVDGLDTGTWEIDGDDIVLEYDDTSFGTIRFGLEIVTLSEGTLEVKDKIGWFTGAGDTLSYTKTGGEAAAIAGTWLDPDGDSWTFNADGTFVDYDSDPGTWTIENGAIVGRYSDVDLSEFNFTWTIVSTSATEMVVTDTEDGQTGTFTRSS